MNRLSLHLAFCLSCLLGYSSLTFAANLSSPLLKQIFADKIYPLAQRFQHKNPLTLLGIKLKNRRALKAFYQQRDYEPIWSYRQNLNSHGKLLLYHLRQTGREGLQKQDYHWAVLEACLEQKFLQACQQGDVELLLSDAFVRYALDVRFGRFQPRDIDPEWYISAPRDWNPLDDLQLALDNKQLLKLIASLPPDRQEYRDLRALLQHYLNLSKTVVWTQVPAGKLLKVGKHDAQIPALRQRLQQSGDLISDKLNLSDWFDPELEQAVAHFQVRHGLEPDGIVGNKTRALLNVSLAQRIAQIRLNMERWRWLPKQLPARHIRVNIAGFYLQAYENHQLQHRINVIIGRLDRSTPIFQKKMTHVVFNPYWVVPHSIAVKDILPKLQKDPSYFYKQKMQLLYKNTPIDTGYINWQHYNRSNFPYQFRQLPGKHNALGQIKFMFPNRFNIYLHDTHHPELFSKAQRTFSSGCVRVEKPKTLAEYVLAKQQVPWSQAEIQLAMDSENSRQIDLDSPIPVYILYWTVWVNEQGLAQFRNDIYGHDQLLVNAFQAAERVNVIKRVD